jgi:hypothetical protein
MRQQDGDSDQVEVNIKHSRQDLRAVVYLLDLMVVLLGIIADLLHKLVHPHFEADGFVLAIHVSCVADCRIAHSA